MKVVRFPGTDIFRCKIEKVQLHEPSYTGELSLACRVWCDLQRTHSPHDSMAC
jgi:hypothetical protein